MIWYRRSRSWNYAPCVFGFTSTLKNFARSLRECNRLDHASQTGLIFEFLFFIILWFVLGWGATDVTGRMSIELQQGKQAVITNKACFKFNKVKYPQLSVTSSMLCAGDGGKTKISGCHGDSGGPFVCEVDGKWELHGVVSHGSKTCDSRDSYSVYARVFFFKKWIQTFMRMAP